MNQPILQISDLEVSIPALKSPGILSRGINLTLHPGQIIPIVGKSGCGKSTFLRTLVLFSPLSKGNISFQGDSIVKMNPAKLRSRMIYLSQTPALFPGNVLTNLTLPFKFKTVQAEVPTREMLLKGMKEVGLEEEKLDVTAERLSVGEAQRVALLRALLLDPAILLLDEPTSGLDPESITHIVERVNSWVHEDNRGVIWVAHDREVIRQISQPALNFTPQGLVPNSAGEPS